MNNGTLMLGVFGLFLLTGTGVKYGIDHTAANEFEALVEENESILKQLDSIERSLIFLQEKHRKSPYKGLAKIISTAYNSEENQTDSTPFITASGARVQNGTLALSRDMIRAENAMMRQMGYNPTATISYGDTVELIYVRKMVVHDTMNKRYTNRGDIWMDSLQDARTWGVRDVYIIASGINN